MGSMALHPLNGTGEKHGFHRRLDFGGMLGAAPVASI